MFPSDALQVLSQSSTQLVILDPPSYSFARTVAVLVVLSMIAMVVGLLRGWGLTALVPLSGTVVGLGLLGFYFGTSQNTITLSKAKGTLEIVHSVFGRNTRPGQIPLKDVKEIIVETIKYNQCLTVIQKSGEPLSLGNGSNREGYYTVAAAMNDFLKNATTSQTN